MASLVTDEETGWEKLGNSPKVIGAEKVYKFDSEA